MFYRLHFLCHLQHFFIQLSSTVKIYWIYQVITQFFFRFPCFFLLRDAIKSSWTQRTGTDIFFFDSFAMVTGFLGFFSAKFSPARVQHNRSWPNRTIRMTFLWTDAHFSSKVWYHWKKKRYRTDETIDRFSIVLFGQGNITITKQYNFTSKSTLFE